MCHAGFAASGFIQQSNLLFKLKTKSARGSDYNSEMNAATFKEWFEACFLPYLAPETVIPMDSARCHSIQRGKHTQ
jgi:hypothetical protein